MKKSDLKEFDNAELRGGSIVVFSPNKDENGEVGFVGPGAHDYTPEHLLKDYNEDMTHKKHKMLDISKVYREGEIMFMRAVTKGQITGSIVDFKAVGTTVTVGSEKDGMYYVFGFTKGARYHMSDCSIKFLDAVYVEENNLNRTIYVGEETYYLIDVKNILGFWRRETID